MPGKAANRNLVLIIAAGLLAVALILLLTNPWSTLKSETNSINLNRPERVNRIVITNQTDSTILTRTDSVWKISGNEPANHVAVENLLFAASRLSIISLLSAEEINEDWECRSINYFSDNKEILK